MSASMKCEEPDAYRIQERIVRKRIAEKARDVEDEWYLLQAMGLDQ